MLIPVNDPNLVCQWDHTSFALAEGKCRLVDPEEDEFTPFTVMGTPGDPDNGVQSLYLTADYDLLMIGFYDGEEQGPPDPPKNIPFDPEKGQITPRQLELVDKLNTAVEMTGYDAGGVTHHGPENQFSKSPYIDYPVTVFVPDRVTNGVQGESTGGKILSVDMGPKGFRDMHLKRLINELREQGYNLYDNPAAPGWHWEWDESIEGYKLEDSDKIGAYVEQLPRNFCDKSGEQIRTCGCYDAPPPPAVQREKPTSWLSGFQGEEEGVTSLSVYPNPIETGTLNISMTSDEYDRLTIQLFNAHGKMEYSNSIELADGAGSDQLDVTQLRSGLYTVSIHETGEALRLVKMQ